MNKLLQLSRTVLQTMIGILIIMMGSNLNAQTDPSEPQTICIGSVENYQVDYLENGGAGTTGSSYTWAVTAGPFAGTITTNQGPSGSSNRIEIDWSTSPAGTYTLQVMEETNGCPGPIVELEIVISPLLTATVTSTSPICSGADAVFSFTGPNNGTIDFTLNGVAATISLDGSGQGTLTVPGVTSTQDVVLVNVSDGTCSNPVTGNSSVTINSLLSASVSSSTSTCSGGDAVFNFTGPANGSIDYTLNGVAASISLDAAGQATLTVPGVTVDQDVVLSEVSDGTCSNPVVGNASVVINSLLSASVSSTTPICSGEDAVFTFTGPANGTIDYTLNGVAASISLDGSGQATLTIPGATADQDVVLTNVSDATCSNPVTGNSSVTINPLLTATVNSTTPVCSSEDAVFTFSGPANGSIDYTLNGVAASISLDGSGSATLTVPGVTADQDVVLTSVSDATCSNPVVGNASVIVNAVLTAGTGSTSPVCTNEDAVFTFSGPANGSIDYTLNGAPATIALDATGQATLTIPGVTANQDVVLVSVSDGTCTNPASGTSSVVVNPLLTAGVTSSGSTCSGGDATFNFTGPANGSIAYTLNGVAATISLDALGQATLTVPGVTVDQDVVLVSVSDATCSNPVTGNASVVINSLLSASVSSTTPICSGEDAVFSFTGPANGTIDYTLNGVAATISLDGSGQATLTVPGATADQDVVLTNVSDATCSNPITGNATVIVNPIPATSPIFHD